jgi:predicted amidohydrolase YtcJ
MTTSTLYRGANVYSAADPRATAMLIGGGQVAWIGPEADAPDADEVVELDGAFVAPAFVDAHVHATDTGLHLSGLDLTGTRSATDLLDAVSAFCRTLPADAVVLGHGWDDSTWSSPVPPDHAELARAGGGRVVYLSQASIHSALCSTALLAAAPDAAFAPGFDPGGWLRRDAHHVVRAVALGSISTVQRKAAQVATLEAAAALGIVAIHECGGPGTSDEDDFMHVLSLVAPRTAIPRCTGTGVS